MLENPVIEVNNLNVSYFLGKSNETRVLKDISLKIYPGEFVIFFGPSGCGKSTLLYSIAGLERQIEGEILVDAKNIADMKEREIEAFHQKKIGMIFQAFYLINSISVMKNVVMPQIAINIGRSERRKRAVELLEKFGVMEQAKKLPNVLSGGQQQRISICRALINNPDILLADEPVGNLDSKSSNDVMGLLKELNETQKKTVILVTHNPAHLDIAHRVFYLKDGKLIKTEVKTPINKKVAEEMVTASISRDLELLARSFSGVSAGSVGNLLIPFKSKQIVSEALTGMTSEEISGIENKVKSLLLTGIREDDNSLEQFLDESSNKGGLGLDKRTAERLSDQIKRMIKEIKYLEAEDDKDSSRHEFDKNEEVCQIRQYLLDEFKVEISNTEVIKRMNQLNQDRLENKIDKEEFAKQLDLPFSKGGAGFDKRTVRGIARRFELLILGKYR